MKKTLMALALTGLTGLAGLAQAEMVTRPVAYEIDGEPYEGMLVYDDALQNPRPGLVMVPNWLGVTDNATEKAALIAGERYVVFVADMYGKGVRPSGPEEAGKVAGALRGDRPLMRKRAQAAVEAFKAQAGQAKLDTGRLAAIGFCFGGGTVLELARSGADLAAFVSFHGNLDTPEPKDAQNIKGPLLVLHGADDPSVPKAQVDAFIAEMKATDIDWQLVMFGNAVHSFTNPEANVPGRNEYNPLVTRRAYEDMNDLLDEVFQAQ